MSQGRRTIRLVAAPALALALLAPTASTASPTPSASAARRGTAPAPAAANQCDVEAAARAVPKSVTTTDIPIRMDDGVVLRGDLVRPALANGKPVPGKVPVLLTITAYNKSVIGAGAGAILAGSDPKYFVKRGYASLVVDARGTGSSAGIWKAFSAREAKDAGAVVEWAHRAPWSNGNVGMMGASYMGISQIFAASHQPAGLKAIFPQVPAADVYRDVVASGGQIDVGFIPLWLGLVTGTGLMPPAYGIEEPAAGFQMLTDHLMTAVSFTVPLMVNAILGGEPAYDGPFYKERSPINVIDKVKVPTFFVGGEYDLFQRGTPLLFERLQKNGVPTRMIWGPWDHLQGSSGAEVGRAGYGEPGRGAAALVRPLRDGQEGRPAAEGHQAAHLLRAGHRPLGPHRQVDRQGPVRAVVPPVRQVGHRLVDSGVLTTGKAKPGTSLVPAIPVTGVCTRSANQWTAGMVNADLAGQPVLHQQPLQRPRSARSSRPRR